MRPWIQVLALFVALAAWPAAVSSANGSLVESSEEAEATVVLRFSNQRVASCGDLGESIARRKLTCRVDKQWTKGTATLLFEPLADPRRRVLRTDRRSPFSVELQQQSQPIERPIPIAKGPWRITWKESRKSVRADIEDVAISVNLIGTIGKCRSGSWRCWLDNRAREHRLEIRPDKGR